MRRRRAPHPAPRADLAPRPQGAVRRELLVVLGVLLPFGALVVLGLFWLGRAPDRPAPLPAPGVPLKYEKQAVNRPFEVM